MNQNPCIPSWPGAFQFDILFSVALSKSTRILISGPSSSPSSSLVIFFYPFSVFVMFLWLPYFSPKSFGLLYCWLLVCFRVTPFQLLVGIFFRCFGMSWFFCIVLPFVDICLVFLLWPVLSGLFPQVVLFFSQCCQFLLPLF